MAVTGKFGDQNIQLDNAAEEATLSDLADTMKKAFGSGGKFDPKSVTGLAKGAKESSQSLSGLLKSATKGSDSLDELSDEAQKSKAAFGRFYEDVKYAGRGLKSAFSSKDATEGAKNVIDGMNDMVGAGLDAAANIVRHPAAKIAIEGVKLTLGALSAAAGASVGAIQEFGENFKELSSMGFIAGEGIGAFNSQVLASGMTFKQFDKLVKESGDDLRNIGGSAAQGARQVMRLRKAMIGQEEQFQRLGYDFDELAPLVAEYAGNLARGASEINISDQQLIDQTAAYAKNLRVVTDLTGMSAKQLKEESEAAATEAKNQAYLMDLERSGRAGASKTFGDVAATLKQIAPGYDELFKDYNTQYGTAMSTTTGMLQSNNPAMAKVLKEMTEGIANGTINQSNAQDILIQKIKENQAGITTGMDTTARLAQAGIEGTERFGIMNRELNNIFATDLPALKKNLEDAAKNRDELTKGVIDIQKANQNIALAQNELAMALGKAGTKLGLIGAVDSAAEAFRNVTRSINGMTGDFSADRMAGAQGAAGRVGEGGLIAPTGTVSTRYAGRAAASTRTFTEEELKRKADFEALDKLTDAELGDLGLKRSTRGGFLGLGGETVIEKKMARGGIIPNMGPEGISITAGDGVSEAVVPLSDGRNIPVKLDDGAFRSMAEKLDLLARLNGAMLNEMQRNNNLTRQGQLLAS